MPLADLPLEIMRGIHPAISEEVYDVLTVEASVASRRSEGGTAPDNVRAAARGWRERLDKESIARMRGGAGA